MSSKIEQVIDEIEEYIDSCKYKPFSNTTIMVEKETIDQLLRELRMKTPDEIKRYQKIISNKEAILNDAEAKAKALIDKATAQTTELISEHEIMQQAYAQANEVVNQAAMQARDILDQATMEANDVRASAMQYLDDKLATVEEVLNQSMSIHSQYYQTLMNSLQSCASVVQADRAELRPVGAALAELEATEKLNADML